MNRLALSISEAAEFLGRFFCVHTRVVLRSAGFLLILLVVVAPSLTTMGLNDLARTIQAIGGVLCHQEPDRCINIAGNPIVVCARCLGGYIGFLIASFLFTASRVRRKLITYPAAFLAVAGVVDIALHFLSVYDTGNMFRLVSGFFVGNGIGILVFGFVSRIEIANQR